MDRALPSAHVVFFISVRFHYVEENFLFFLFGDIFKEKGVVCKKLELSFGGVDIFVLCNTLKCVSHKCDDHVKHRQLGKESCEHEEHYAENIISAICIVLAVEATDC